MAWPVVWALATPVVPAPTGVRTLVEPTPVVAAPTLEPAVIPTRPTTPLVPPIEPTPVVAAPTLEPAIVSTRSTATLVPPTSRPVIPPVESTTIVTPAPSPLVPPAEPTPVVPVPRWAIVEPTRSAPPVVPLVAPTERTSVVSRGTAPAIVAPTSGPIVTSVERVASFPAVIPTSVVVLPATAIRSLTAIAELLVPLARSVITTVRSTGPPVVTFAARAMLGHAFSYLHFATRHRTGTLWAPLWT